MNKCCPIFNGEFYPRKNESVMESTDTSFLDMVLLKGGEFFMGAGSGRYDKFSDSCELPARKVNIDSFYMSRYQVTNASFSKFVSETGYRTDAEVIGWSYVFFKLLSPKKKREVSNVPQDTPWWYPIDGACWKEPEGVGSNLSGRGTEPVVHVSWNDAKAFAKWVGGDLPTEAQWEYASRGGLEGYTFPWGNELVPDGKHMCNVWQGRFPGLNTALDGYVGVSPVGSYESNGFGLYDTIGNVWEWCRDSFDPNYHRITPNINPCFNGDTALKSMRGGSFLCHVSYCARYRNSARSSNIHNATSSNIGFRIMQ